MTGGDEAVGSTLLAETEAQGDPVVSAIQRVLEAERAAEKQLQHCRRQAQAVVAAARDKAAAVVRRASDRAARLHASYLQRIARDIAGLSPPIDPGSDVAERSDEGAAWSQAAARLAAKLTGGEDETPR
ncbi:MAG TPA: hypothetical protein VEI03_00805 [Stellaceae bacterium]|nr:hypothetical protein [Stellaceae bacterium]